MELSNSYPWKRLHVGRIYAKIAQNGRREARGSMALIIRSLSLDADYADEDAYLGGIEALRTLKQLAFSAQVTFFVGENGSGKSTLLEAMAVGCGFNPEGGTQNYRFSTYDSHSSLCRHIHMTRSGRLPSWGLFLRAESYYNVESAEEAYGESASRHYHAKSHGESFLEMMQQNFRPGGLYFLDEPEAALSPQRQMTLLMEIDRAAGTGAQFFIATHSPILLALPGAQILSFDGSIRPIAYTDTESYRITDMFINRREQIIKRLLEDE